MVGNGVRLSPVSGPSQGSSPPRRLRARRLNGPPFAVVPAAVEQLDGVHGQTGRGWSGRSLPGAGCKYYIYILYRIIYIYIFIYIKYLGKVPFHHAKMIPGSHRYIDPHLLLWVGWCVETQPDEADFVRVPPSRRMFLDPYRP